MELDPQMMVADLLARWPGVVPVFLRHRLGCVGCAMAPYDSLAEVATTYGIAQAVLLAELEAAIAAVGADAEG